MQREGSQNLRQSFQQKKVRHSILLDSSKGQPIAYKNYNLLSRSYTKQIQGNLQNRTAGLKKSVKAPKKQEKSSKKPQENPLARTLNNRTTALNDMGRNAKNCINLPKNNNSEQIEIVDNYADHGLDDRELPISIHEKASSSQYVEEMSSNNASKYTSNSKIVSQ